MARFQKRIDVWEKRDKILELYTVDSLSAFAISKMFNCHRKVIVDIIKSHGIPYRPKFCVRSGEKHHMWKGGRIKTIDGYIAIYQPSHPNATQAGYVLEHRLVMEQKIGRYLLKSEKVHHINGVRDDNRPENLELFSIANHNLRHDLCNQCPLRKEIRLLRWQIRELSKQLQGKLGE